MRRGFTLIEMLISVALVLLMMSMFAQIFQMAGSSISRQRGLMENDQRARTMQTIIKGDLDKRTFRRVLSFAIDEDTTQVEAEISKRRGYFYISENDPTNQLDDVLQFTTQSTIVVYNKDQSPYYGRALQLTSFGHPNQPDADDAQLVPNNTGLSTLAEVSYFVRNGSLYRRQLLIREPLPVAGASEQPVDIDDDNFFDPSLTGSAAPVVLYPSGVTVSTASNFWNDFDYSAYLTFESTSPPSGNDLIYTGTSTITGAAFLGANALNNDDTANIQLGKPMFRFGHQAPVSTGVAPPFLMSEIGQPKEYTDTTGTAEFIGRFTLEECSHSSFTYPQQRGSDPMRRATSLTLNSDKVVTGLSGGSRRGEDLLMSNVHSFDVQVWDDAAGSAGLGAFVDIGGTGASDYAMAKNKHLNPTDSGSPFLYGPSSTASNNRIFDTWHLDTQLDDPASAGTAIDAPPPFRPRYYRPTYTTDNATDTTPTRDAWAPGTAYSVGDIRFPTAANLPNGMPFYYRCVEAAGTGLSGPAAANEPSWPRLDGLRVKDNETYDNSTTPPTLTNRVTWEAVDNRKPLKAIKLEIRFVDTSTQQMRQLTIIQSLVD